MQKDINSTLNPSKCLCYNVTRDIKNLFKDECHPLNPIPSTGGGTLCSLRYDKQRHEMDSSEEGKCII